MHTKSSPDKLYELCGTPVYLAPEIYVSGMFERSNPKCVGYSYPVDAWACGVIMFTLLIGKHKSSVHVLLMGITFYNLFIV